MTRGEILLVGLLLVAMGLISAVVFFVSDGVFWRDSLVQVGLALGQIVLASAAVVFLGRMLWLRLLVQLAVILVSSWLVSRTSPMMPAFLPLLGVALIATAWCAWLRFLGWQITRSDAQPTPTRQFSLATLMLIMTIVAVYLGLLRAASATGSGDDVTLAMISAVLVIPACLMLTATARHTLAWLAPAAIVGLFYGVLWIAEGHGLSGLQVKLAMIVLTTELSFVTATLIVLRIAGIHLTLPNRQSARQNTLLAGETSVSA